MCLFGPAIRAITAELEVDIGEGDFFPFAEQESRFFHLGRFKFDYASALETGKMMVEGTADRLEVGMVLPQPVLLNQLGIAQQRQGPVDGGQADLRVPGFGFPVERIRIQVPLGIPQDIQHQLALAGEADRRGSACLHGKHP